jgi:hypothetical protein
MSGNREISSMSIRFPAKRPLWLLLSFETGSAANLPYKLPARIFKIAAGTSAWRMLRCLRGTFQGL